MSALPLHDYHSTTTKLLLIILVTLTAAFTTAPKAYSATIPLGSVTQVSQPPYPCGSTFYPGMLCFDATVVCPSTDNINVTFGYTGPTQLTTPLGTIVFFSGGTGTTPAAPGEDLTAYSDEYVKKYRIVQIAWESAWEKATASGAQSILLAACRPATLLKWINDSAAVHPAGAMCAQGKSAGSGAIAYAMSWYGAGGYLKNVELLAGPCSAKLMTVAIPLRRQYPCAPREASVRRGLPRGPEAWGTLPIRPRPSTLGRARPTARSPAAISQPGPT